jgi:predicted nucleic acid-binding protein
MHVIVDTNILFSALLSNQSKIGRLLLNSNFCFYAPKLIADEINQNMNKLKRFSKMNPVKMETFIHELYRKIIFIDQNAISTENIQMAVALCKEVDTSDAPFVALSLELNMPLWTGDKKLKAGLTKKGFNHFFEISPNND